MTLAELPQAWRQEAQVLRTRYRTEHLAALAEAHAAELEEALRGQAEELLDLQQATLESGYKSRHLRRLMKEGKVPTTEDGRVRRGDLPRKPGTGVQPDPASVLGRQIMRAVALEGGDDAS